MVFTPGLERTLSVRVQSSGVSELNRGLGGITERLGSMRGAVALAGGALTALSVGGLAKATAAAAEFEEAMVEVQKVTDETTARALSGEIQDLATTIPIAQGELAALTADAARFGIRGTENIRAFTETTARMATATDLSTQEAGEAFARLATLTGTPVTEMENLGSAVNTLSNTMATSSGEIVDSMLRSSGAMAQLGVQNTDIIALSAALNEVSESSERAGTRLRRLAQVLVDPSKQEDIANAMGMTADGFDEMVESDPTGVIVRMARVMAEGGEQADQLNTVLDTRVRAVLAGLAQNLDGVNEALETSSSSFEDATSLQREFDAATDTFNARLRLTRNRLGNIAIETGEVLLPVMTDLLGVVNAGVTAFSDLNEQSHGVVGALLGIGGAAAGAGIALSALGLAAGGPVTLAIAGIGALGLAYSNNWADIREVTDRSVSDVARSLSRLENLLTGSRGEVDKTESVWSGFLGFLTKSFTAGLEIVGQGFATIIDAMVTQAEVSMALMRGDFKRVFEIGGEFMDRFETRNRELNRRIREIGTGFDANVADQATPSQSSMREEGREDAQAYKEGFEQETQTGTGAGSGGGAVALSAEDRAALIRGSTISAVRARRSDDAFEIPGMAGLAARAGGSIRTREEWSALGARGKQQVVLNVREIHASSEEGGRAAVRGMNDELQSANIVDTGTVTGP